MKKKNICDKCDERAKVQAQLKGYKVHKVVGHGQRFAKATPEMEKMCWEHYVSEEKVVWILKHFPENMTDEELVEWDQWLMLYGIASPKEHEVSIFPISE